MPDKVSVQDPSLSSDLKKFPSENEIEYWDPLEFSKRERVTVNDYWNNDGHSNLAGNERYAAFLKKTMAERWEMILTSQRQVKMADT